VVEPGAQQIVAVPDGRLSPKEVEQYLSEAADLLRGSFDQADFKAHISRSCSSSG
jgi:type I restriction enzyme M protein